MTGWRFAFSARWAGYLSLAVVFAIVCSMLGIWQFERRAEARAAIDLSKPTTTVSRNRLPPFWTTWTHMTRLSSGRPLS